MAEVKLFKAVFDTLKKIVDTADDIWMSMRKAALFSKIETGKFHRISSVLIGSLGFTVHFLEAFFAVDDLRETYQSLNDKNQSEDRSKPRKGQLKSRILVSSLTILLAMAGMALSAMLIASAKGAVIPFTGLYPFLISGLLFAMYSMALVRKGYSYSEFSQQYQASSVEVQKKQLREAKYEFGFGFLEVAFSGVGLFGLAMTIEDYFRVANIPFAENAIWFLVAGAAAGLLNKAIEAVFKEHDYSPAKVWDYIKNLIRCGNAPGPARNAHTNSDNLTDNDSSIPKSPSGSFDLISGTLLNQQALQSTATATDLNQSQTIPPTPSAFASPITYFFPPNPSQTGNNLPLPNGNITSGSPTLTSEPATS